MFHIGIAVQHPPLPEPHQLSELGIDFIRQCLHIDPEQRPTAEELMTHPWIMEATEQINLAYEQESGPTSSLRSNSSTSYSAETAASSYEDGQAAYGPQTDAIVEEEEPDEYEEDYVARDEEDEGGYEDPGAGGEDSPAAE